MIHSFLTDHYLIIITQVLVTLLLVPFLSIKILKKAALSYGVRVFPKATSDVYQFIKGASKRLWSAAGLLFVLASVIVGHAVVKQTELFNWDNQAGLMVLYLLAMIPVVVMYFMHKRLFDILKVHAGPKRSASLKPRKLKDFISWRLATAVCIANIVFIGTVTYFTQSPFDGFAGYGNLIGLVFLNALFAVVIWTVFNDKKSGTFANPYHRDAFKRKAIHINLVILALALFHISLSMWVSGTALNEYKLLTQSVYLQIVLVITAHTLTLPKAMFDEGEKG
jgi:hypothetical protein